MGVFKPILESYLGPRRAPTLLTQHQTRAQEEGLWGSYDTRGGVRLQSRSGSEGDSEERGGHKLYSENANQIF